jgi:hypothetical protein
MNVSIEALQAAGGLLLLYVSLELLTGRDMGGEDFGSEPEVEGGDMGGEEFGAEPDGDMGESLHGSIFDSIFGESKVDKVISKYFHITKEEKLSVKLRDETRTALNIYDHDKIRRVLHDKSEKLLAWYKSSRKDLSDLKNRIDTEITSPVSWVYLEVANRDSGGDREIRTG